MEIISRKVSEFIDKQSSKYKPVVIDDIEKVKSIQIEMSKQRPFSSFLKTNIDNMGNISINREHEIKFPYRINFDKKEGYFLDNNIFRPRPFLDSNKEGSLPVLNYLKDGFVYTAFQLGFVESPKIILPESFERIDLSNIFGNMEILICYKSEVPKLIPRANNNKYYSY